jgi:hypothetical protein
MSTSGLHSTRYSVDFWIEQVSSLPGQVHNEPECVKPGLRVAKTYRITAAGGDAAILIRYI